MAAAQRPRPAPVSPPRPPPPCVLLLPLFPLHHSSFGLPPRSSNGNNDQEPEKCDPKNARNSSPPPSAVAPCWPASPPTPPALPPPPPLPPPCRAPATSAGPGTPAPTRPGRRHRPGQEVRGEAGSSHVTDRVCPNHRRPGVQRDSPPRPWRWSRLCPLAVVLLDLHLLLLPLAPRHHSRSGAVVTGRGEGSSDAQRFESPPRALASLTPPPGGSSTFSHRRHG